MTEKYPRIKSVGDCTILIEYEEEVSPGVNKKVRKLAYNIEKHSFPGVIEVVPAFRSLMVFFDPLKVNFENVTGLVEQLVIDPVEIELSQPRLFKVPTVYGGIYGPDLDRVSEYTKLTPDEIISLFSSKAYLVYFLGFLCGLACLGGIPEILEVPRLTSPRPFVPVGSVGFAGRQANILSIDQPSGFNYIGRSFVKVYDSQQFPPTLFRPGDYIQFPSVCLEVARSAGEKDLGDFIESI
jgi:inhibitor of KinA